MSEQQTDLDSKKINLNIITPRGVKFQEQADTLIMRAIDGDLGVLAGHEPVSAVLGEGILQIFNDGVEKKLAVFNGFVEIDDTEVNIMTTIAQSPEEIDLERAEQDRREAEASLEESESEDVQIQSMQVLLHRSLVRIEVSHHMEDE